jgi:hypothetical protein
MTDIATVTAGAGFVRTAVAAFKVGPEIACRVGVAATQAR